MAGAVSPALVGFLRADRDGLNGRFAHARRRLPGLDGEVFAAFLASALGPLLDRVAALRAGRAGGRADDGTHDVGHAAYDVALELVGQRLAGSGAREPRVGACWSAVTVAAAERVVESPVRVLTAVANALAHLASTPGARPEEWATRMIEIAPVTGSLDAWLEAGQVLAWRCGLAHLREGALALCERIAPALGPSLVGAPPGADWAVVRARLVADPWYAPSVAGSGLRVVGRVGGFRGHGGLFVAPPVASRGGADRFLIQSGDDAWVLFADAGGATFHRATDDERAEVRRGPISAPAGPVVRDGRLEHRGRSVALPVRGQVTSVAASGTTAAVTCSQTHAIALVALADDENG